MAAPVARIVRDAQEIAVPARDVVPGDVLVLRAGDRIAADARLLEAVNLEVQEGSLTGESLSVAKQVEPLADPTLAIGDRHNMVYAGTAATYGRGLGLVVGTGMATEFGQIAEMLATVETGRTPLQDNLDRLGRLLAQGCGRHRASSSSRSASSVASRSSRCSCSVSRWRWPSCPRRCPPSSRSRWHSACSDSRSAER